MELLAGAAATLRFPAYGEDAVDLGEEPTVTITRDSTGAEVGEELEVTAVEPEEESSEIEYWTVDLTPEQLAEVDILTVVWSDGTSSYTQLVEIVGGYATSVAAILAKLEEEAATADVEAKRELASRDIEHECGHAFRPRYARDQLNGSGTVNLNLSRRNLIRLISVTVEGTALSEAELAELTLDPIGKLKWESGWPRGISNIEVVYVYGYKNFPMASIPIRDLASYMLAKRPTDVDDRATSFATDYGTFALVTPGVRGARFPLPNVNAFCAGFRAPLVG